ncbi:FAD-dependent pyridine nucleotide-disulfide oxidoreductase [Calothrix sp. NIES-4101]|nr:FAD-dependent pyridine nucleotide-disulfide oxidoreductase [Calothrix sp. NIES-4101]
MTSNASKTTTKQKNIVLLGGGHSHAILLRSLADKPLPNVNFSLITENRDTPYSGMLPGHIAGFYTHDECHINLEKLTNFAGAKLYIDEVINLDLENNKVISTHLPEIEFDILSIDIGSTPATITVPGAKEYAIPAKPVSILLREWDKFCREIIHYSPPIRIAIVGGGAGGVELALAMRAKLNNLNLHENQEIEIHLFHRDQELMPSYHLFMRHLLTKVLLQQGIKLNLKETVCKIEKLEKLHLNCESGLTWEGDRIFWVTQASAPQWLKTTGVKTDKNGFILVNEQLQSLSHPHIFATGDIATMVNYPRSKAGVFAVRQGKPLFANLRRYVLGKALKPYIPQAKYLSLIGTGDGKAIANRGNFTLPPSRLLWLWKDCLDRRFMQQFK